MLVNIKRHSYVDYTGKPYIYYHGVPYEKPVYTPYVEPDRTVIRSLQSNRQIINHVPDNGMGLINKMP